MPERGVAWLAIANPRHGRALAVHVSLGFPDEAPYTPSRDFGRQALALTERLWSSVSSPESGSADSKPDHHRALSRVERGVKTQNGG